MRRTKLIIFRITFIINCFSTEQVLYGRIYHRHELRAISWPVHCENETDNELLGHNHIDIEKRALPHEIFAQFLNSDYSGSPLQPTRLCNDSERRASPKASHHAFSLSCLSLPFVFRRGGKWNSTCSRGEVRRRKYIFRTRFLFRCETKCHVDSARTPSLGLRAPLSSSNLQLKSVSLFFGSNFFYTVEKFKIILLRPDLMGFRKPESH